MNYLIVKPSLIVKVFQRLYFCNVKMYYDMARIVIPVSDKLLSNQFSDCTYYKVYETKEQYIISSREEKLQKVNVHFLSTWIKDNGITDIIVHQMKQSLVSHFSDTKVNLFLGVAINTPEHLVEEYLNGTLQSNAKNMVIE